MKQQSNASFSLRSWAKQMGLKSHGPLHAMLGGQRNIPKKYIPFFAKSFKLKVNEVKYFEAMIDLQKARSFEEKELHMEKMRSLSPGPLREIYTISSYKYLSNPLHFFILEMIELKDFQFNLKWIKDHLRIKVSMGDIEEAIERLVLLGLVIKKDDLLVKTHKHLSNQADAINEGARIYTKNMLEIAHDQHDKQESTAREYNSYTFNINPQNLPEIKDKIRKFSDEIIKEFETPTKEGVKTYHLNVNFFAITK